MELPFENPSPVNRHAPHVILDEGEDSDIEEDDEDDLDFFLAAAEAENSTDDAYIAEALNKLSLKEREEILYNMHGVGEAFEETPEIVRRGLEEFEQCLDRMQGKRKASAYRTALSVSKEYVEREDLILLFLRS